MDQLYDQLKLYSQRLDCGDHEWGAMYTQLEKTKEVRDTYSVAEVEAIINHLHDVYNGNRKTGTWGDNTAIPNY